LRGDEPLCAQIHQHGSFLLRERQGIMGNRLPFLDEPIFYGMVNDVSRSHAASINLP
jgi:hypothetical protein